MRGVIGALVCVFVVGCSRTPGPTAAGGKGATPAAPPTDLQALQGVWRCTSAVDRGKTLPPNELGAGEYEFRDNVMIIREHGMDDQRDSFELDTTRSPRVMRINTPEQDPPVVEAIYEVNGDTLKFAFFKSPGPPPTSFEVPPGSKMQMFVFERKK